jgi:hypothetical protein
MFGFLCYLPLEEGVAKGTSVILSDSEESAFAMVPRDTNSRSFAVAQDDKGLLRHPLEADSYPR